MKNLILARTQMFGASHLLAILCCTILFFAVFFCRKFFMENKKADKFFRIFMGVTLLFFEAAYWVYRTLQGNMAFVDYISTAPCTYLIITLGFAFLFDFKAYIKIVFPIALVCGLLSICMLDLQAVFPQFRYFQFFVGHFLIILGPCYYFMTGRIKSYRYKDLFISILGIAVFVLPIAIQNIATGTNSLYMFLPPTGLEFIKDALGGFYTPLFLLLVFLLLNLILAVVYFSTRSRIWEELENEKQLKAERKEKRQEQRLSCWEKIKCFFVCFVQAIVNFFVGLYFTCKNYQYSKKEKIVVWFYFVFYIIVFTLMMIFKL